jgi:hypothetical protein
MTQKNGNWIKLAGVFLTIILLTIGWIWKTSSDAKEIAYKLAINDAIDTKAHTEFQTNISQQHDDILRMQENILYIRQSVDEIKKQVNKP